MHDGQFGPTYNVESATLNKWRTLAKRRRLTPEEKRAYGDAVETVIKIKQRSEFMRSAVEPEHRSNCASRTWHTTGEEIHKAVRQQQRAALLACPAQERRARTPAQWQEMYEQAMREKREHETKMAIKRQRAQQRKPIRNQRNRKAA